MASTYSDLKIELIGTGEQVGTWGATTNTNLGTALGEAITGSADVSFSSSDVTLTLTNTNGTQTARNLRLVCTATSGGARNLILGSGCQNEKLYLIQNDLADTVTVKNTTGTGVDVPAGARTFVFNNGTNVIPATNASGFSGTLPVANGGTGATDAGNARTNLGLGTISTQNSNSVSITGGSITGITDLAVADGGTGASTAANARTNLGLGSLATLNTISNDNWSGTDLAVGNGGTGASDAGTARSNLGVPSTTGSGASGTWGINITGNAATASNGGVTSLNGQTGAITNTNLDAIGSYAGLQYAASTISFPTGFSPLQNVLASGTTIAGSSLRRLNSAAGPYFQTGTQFLAASLFSDYTTYGPGFGAPPAAYPDTVNTTTMSGTWRLVGGNTWSIQSDTYSRWYTLLWVRIS